MKLDFTKKVVDVQIKNASGNLFLTDLQTIMVMSVHTHMLAPEVYRVYTQANMLIQDGFTTDDYAYRAVNIAFSQEVKPRQIIVTNTVTDNKYLEMLSDMLGSQDGWLWAVSDCRDVTIQTKMAELIETTDRYFVAVSHDDKALASSDETDIASVLKEKQLNHTYCWFDDEYVVTPADGSTPAVTAPNATETALIARCSSGIIGTVQFKNKKLINAPVSKRIKLDTDQVNLEKKGYTFSAYASGSTYSFGSCKVMSGEWVDIMLGITWLIVNIRQDLFNLITAVDKISFDNDGIASVEAVVRSRLLKARDIGILAKDSNIDVFVPDALELTIAERATRILPNVSFSCRMAGAIIAVVVRGEVYQ